jgi:hypothetical protein
LWPSRGGGLFYTTHLAEDNDRREGVGETTRATKEKCCFCPRRKRPRGQGRQI